MLKTIISLSLALCLIAPCFAGASVHAKKILPKEPYVSPEPIAPQESPADEVKVITVERNHYYHPEKVKAKNGLAVGFHTPYPTLSYKIVDPEQNVNMDFAIGYTCRQNHDQMGLIRIRNALYASDDGWQNIGIAGAYFPGTEPTYGVSAYLEQYVDTNVSIIVDLYVFKIGATKALDIFSDAIIGGRLYLN